MDHKMDVLYDAFNIIADTIPDTDDEVSDFEDWAGDELRTFEYIVYSDKLDEYIEDESTDRREIDGVVIEDIYDNNGRILIPTGARVQGVRHSTDQGYYGGTLTFSWDGKTITYEINIEF